MSNVEFVLQLPDDDPSEIVVHGHRLKPGDYYIGKHPRHVGIWQYSKTRPTKVLEWFDRNPYVRDCNATQIQLVTQEYLDRGDEVIDNAYAEGLIFWWVYLGPIPVLGSCAAEPESFIPNVEYRFQNHDHAWEFLLERMGVSWFARKDRPCQLRDFNYTDGPVRATSGDSDAAMPGT